MLTLIYSFASVEIMTCSNSNYQTQFLEIFKYSNKNCQLSMTGMVFQIQNSRQLPNCSRTSEQPDQIPNVKPTYSKSNSSFAPLLPPNGTG
jgi:hypothetical protein